MVAASGNDFDNPGGSRTSPSVYYPQALGVTGEVESMILVGSANKNGKRAKFTNAFNPLTENNAHATIVYAPGTDV